jgi:hypothetical protein
MELLQYCLVHVFFVYFYRRDCVQNVVSVSECYEQLTSFTTNAGTFSRPIPENSVFEMVRRQMYVT